jgi:type IV pilus assembly protein PilW
MSTFSVNNNMRNNFKNSKRFKLLGYKTEGFQSGFTLLELMISLAVGLVIFAGVLSVFVGMKTTVKETSSSGELQENARFAISVLTDDLLQQNFWGDYTGLLDSSSLDAIPDAPSIDCVGAGTNNSTYPVQIEAASNFRTLWGETSSSAGDTGITCISDATPDSDVIQLKRVISNAVVPVANFSYFVASVERGAIYNDLSAIPIINNSRTWQYQHHVYYVRAGIPVLMKWRLTSQMINEPIVDGIERIYFMYGISNVINPTAVGFGVVNAYVSAENMTPALWNNTNTSIRAVKIYVLARSLLPDNQYNNENTYTLGDQAPYKPADNFRRLLLSSTVTLNNADIDIWTERAR